LHSNRPQQNPAGFFIGGIVLVSIAVGLPLMGWFISISGGPNSEGAFYPMIGVGLLVGLLGLALLIGGLLVGKVQRGEPRVGPPALAGAAEASVVALAASGDDKAFA